MRKKDFNLELDFFLNKIKKNENFSLSRWGDGELMILENKKIDLRYVKNGEFRYDPNMKEYDNVKDIMNMSYSNIDDNYYIGIACTCCVGDEKNRNMKAMSGQNEDNLTWANIFVNRNYNTFMKTYIEEFKKHNIIMVVNNMADTSKLSFDVKQTYHVGTDAWYNNYNLIDIIEKDIKKNDTKDSIFLFAAGPLANILTYKLWNKNKNNTYIDIGSVFDVQMGMKPTRGYLNGAPTLNKKCIW